MHDSYVYLILLIIRYVIVDRCRQLYANDFNTLIKFLSYLISLSWFSGGFELESECCFSVQVGNPEKNNQLNPHVAPGQNRTQATLPVGERSPHNHCAIPAPPRFTSDQ